jgi:DNA modification methylase
VALDIATVDWATIEEASYHGAIVGGDVAAHVDELWRILMPGAHVLTIPPEEQPTGHTGAIALEDRGFEIRDAILLVDEPGKYHYVPKPSQRERHAGCEHLKLWKMALERAEREKALNAAQDEEDADLLAEAEVDPETDEVEEGPIDLHQHKGNTHPTVKARAIMAKLLEGVPKGLPVLDPFMGSGSTALACLETGHDFIGIEMEVDYIEIADARVRFWDRARIGDGARIESEFVAPEVWQEATDLDDFFEP